MAATLTHKRGDRFAHRCTYRVGGLATALGSAPRAQLRDASDQLVQELTVTLETQSGSTTGVFTISATAAETSSWPVASLSCDIQLTDTEVSSETFAVRVLADVTR